MTFLKYILSTRLTSFDINLGVNLPGLGSVCHVSSLKLLLRLHTVLFGRKSMQPTLTYWGLPHLLKGRVSKLSGVLRCGRFVYSLQLFLYSVFYLTLYMLRVV